jgi:hypothetical protein
MLLNVFDNVTRAALSADLVARWASEIQISAPTPRGNTKAAFLPTVEMEKVAGRGLTGHQFES